MATLDWPSPIQRSDLAYSMPWRPIVALFIAATGIALVFPLMPWAQTVRQWAVAPGWPLAPWVVGLSLALAAGLLPKSPRRSCARWPHARAIALGMGVLCLLQPALHAGLLTWAGWNLNRASLDLVWPPAVSAVSWQTWLQQSIVLIAIPALAEEWFFRGRLLPWLQQHVGAVSALSLSSLWFAAVHGDPLSMVVALPLGIALALLYLLTGSLYACIIVHAAHNLLILSLGGLLVARPDLALILTMGGAWLVLSALPHGLGGLRRSHTAMLGIVAALALHTGYRYLQETLWIHAARRQILAEQVPSTLLLPRLEQAQRHRIVSASRQQALVSALLNRAQPERSEWWWRLAAIDQHAAITAAQEQTLHAEHGLYTLIRHLAAYPQAHHGLQVTAALASALDPPALIAVAVEDPPALALLLPHAAYAELVVHILAAVDIRQRTRLLGSARLVWGQDVAAALHLALPAAAVGPRDRHYLLRHHPQARALIAALADSDPKRHAAWDWSTAP